MLEIMDLNSRESKFYWCTIIPMC